MILKALYDYYHRCGDLPASGMEEKEIGFLVVISNDGKFVRFEDCRIDNKHAKVYLVKKHVGRSSAAVANYLYDNSAYVLGYSEELFELEEELPTLKKEIEKYDDKRELSKEEKDIYAKKLKELEKKKKDLEKRRSYFDVFKEKVESIKTVYPENSDIKAISHFYEQGRDVIYDAISKDPLWEIIKKNLSKKYSTFSFRIEGDTKIVAEKKEILQLDSEVENGSSLCLITGERGNLVDTTTATMIPGSQATAKLVAFQVNSGYDSYGKTKCGNAPITKEAEFAYTTALNTMLGKDSHNKFMVGNRTFLFWASSKNQVSEQAEESIFDLFGFSDDNADDPNAKIEQVRKVFTSIYSGSLKTDLDDRFYILGLAQTPPELPWYIGRRHL